MQSESENYYEMSATFDLCCFKNDIFDVFLPKVTPIGISVFLRFQFGISMESRDIGKSVSKIVGFRFVKVHARAIICISF